MVRSTEPGNLSPLKGRVRKDTSTEEVVTKEDAALPDVKDFWVGRGGPAGFFELGNWGTLRPSITGARDIDRGAEVENKLVAEEEEEEEEVFFLEAVYLDAGTDPPPGEGVMDVVVALTLRDDGVRVEALLVEEEREVPSVGVLVLSSMMGLHGL